MMDTINQTHRPVTAPNLVLEASVDEKLFAVYRLYYFVIDAIFCFPTTFGNILILLSLVQFAGLRKSTSSILIANLAVSDLLVGAVVFPIHMLLLMNYKLSRNVTFCLTHHSLVYSLVGTSVLNLFLLSIERFHSIMRPFEHAKTFTKFRIYITIFLIWIFMLSFGFLPVMGWYDTVNDNSYFKCGTTQLLDTAYTNVMCSLIVTSLFINGLLFVIIANVAMKAASAFSDVTATDEHQNRIRKNIKHTRMMLIVSGLFIVFWAPYCILALVPNKSNTVKLIMAWCGSLGLINSCVNWVVYSIRSEKFRIAFKAILTRNCEKANNEISNLT